MKINPTQRFRDGRTTYEPGTEYDVPDMDGAYFVRNGWATSPDYTPPGVEPAPTVDVQPDSVAHKATSKEA
ncbi:MAG TPA: hypothetical protein VGW74_01190 [Propionibacteriaceae bacterium]|nr:hypothetical protein [Propionibacteriaceae bacterium]